MRRGIRLVFDPRRERIWTVCDRCHGWNLWWTDDRSRALEALERTATDRARVLFETDHVSLLEADGRQIVRVGAPPRREEAWWRYGRQLRRREAHFRSSLTGLGAVTYSAVSAVGRSLGFEAVTGNFRDVTDRRVEVLRWRRFGGTAWYGRAPCPGCNSALIRLFFFKSPDLVLAPGSEGGLTVGLPCTRCDPWTVEKTYRFSAPVSAWVLRRALAWHNVSGATQAELDAAADLIDTEGSSGRFMARLAEQHHQLGALQRTERLALEMCVNHRAERKRLSGLVVDLEAKWRRAEELAAIIDTEL